MKSITLVFLVLTSATAPARLVETPAQIEKRYGPPSTIEEVGGRRLIPKDTRGFLYGLPTTNYLFKEYVVTVSFKDGRSVRESVTPKDPRKLTETECRALRDAIGAGLSWRGGWTTELGTTAEMRGSEFVVESVDWHKYFEDYVRREEKRKAEADKKKADGF